MLDHISISHQSGLILWSRSFTPAFTDLAASVNSPVNSLIKEALIEGKARGEDEVFERDGYSVRWTMENGLGLVFVVVFPALLPLTYIPAMLQRVKQLFLSLFEPYLQSLVDVLSNRGGVVDQSRSALRTLGEKIVEDRWDKIFDRCLKNFEGSGGRSRSLPQRPDVSDDNRAAPSAEEIAKNVQALKGRMKGRKGGRGRNTASPSPVPSPSRKASGTTAKLMRKWGDSQVSSQDMAALDYSAPAPETATVDVDALVSTDAMGTRTATGNYEVADWDYGRTDDLPTEEEILARRTQKLKIDDDDEEPEDSGTWTNMFSRLSGKKVLTKEDLRPVLADMEKHLMSKNVAKDIAEKLCDAVGSAIVGKKLGGLTSVKSEVQRALSDSMTRILTPKTSTDILVDIQRKRSQPSSIADPNSPPDPYAITFVGVNGVGKSTNLSKVCFWLLQNNMRVLIAACDTFRSGAVEQLRVHVRNLGALGDELGMGTDAAGQRRIELYERGYGKDAAGIAKDAIAYAKENRFDVVLIDTAGRMQDNEPLMRALAKLVTVNNPDKIVFVGEALVGNEAVDQLTKFDRALKDFSSASGSTKRRGIDGILLTKFDTIDDKVGAALSMTTQGTAGPLAELWRPLMAIHRSSRPDTSSIHHNFSVPHPSSPPSLLPFATLQRQPHSRRAYRVSATVSSPISSQHTHPPKSSRPKPQDSQVSTTPPIPYSLEQSLFAPARSLCPPVSKSS
ncbi:signal recognition particle binding protein [Trichosporon asahii var. asahii CBS 8904]|uniref:Signal recognition particle receptor subunit alpha homolog n=1 Tax=Trichosporon asahii var. asahii (strain CBS 8904) TaxID=1220162 RepID=K1VSV4_TRIAC|nr:signal recognition particle binding protein [Trichosporon asahii var. asahii CBS 8904]